MFVGWTKPSRARLTVAGLIVLSWAACATGPLASARSWGGGQSVNRAPSLSPQARVRVRQAIAAVGLILVRNASDLSKTARPRGSGVVVRSDGVVVTNYHVISDNRTNRLYDEIFFTLSEDGAAAGSNRYRLKAVLINRDYDLVLLRVESDLSGDPVRESVVFPTIEIGNSQAIQLLDDLTIIGFPDKGGTSVTVNSGVVEGKDVLGKWIKTDARVIRGNSGGAAVDSRGKLIGIPTKVVADSQPIDKNGDGFPDDFRVYGAVGFLRPSELVADMLGQIGRQDPATLMSLNTPQVVRSDAAVTVRGVVKSFSLGKPVAGARVGLIPLGSKSVTEANLLTWGGTNADGQFVLNKSVPPGQYTLKAKAIGYEAYTQDVSIDEKAMRLVIELRPLKSNR